MATARVDTIEEILRTILSTCTAEEREQLLKRLADLGIGERAEIEAALALVGGNIADAAKRLGCARRTLQDRMRRLNMPRGRRGRPMPRTRVAGGG